MDGVVSSANSRRTASGTASQGLLAVPQFAFSTEKGKGPVAQQTQHRSALVLLQYLPVLPETVVLLGGEVVGQGFGFFSAWLRLKQGVPQLRFLHLCPALSSPSLVRHFTDSNSWSATQAANMVRAWPKNALGLPWSASARERTRGAPIPQIADRPDGVRPASADAVDGHHHQGVSAGEAAVEPAWMSTGKASSLAGVAGTLSLNSPPCNSAAAARISSILDRAYGQAPESSTITARRRPARFCWCRMFWSVVISSS